MSKEPLFVAVSNQKGGVGKSAYSSPCQLLPFREKLERGNH